MLRTALIATGLAGLAVGASQTAWQSALISKTGAATPSACSSAAAGDVCAADDVIMGDDLSVTDDALISGDLTVTGTATIGTLGAIAVADEASVTFGTGSDAIISYDTTQAPDSLVIGVSVDSRMLVIGDKADVQGTDLVPGAGAASTPTVYIHSDDATTATEYLTLTHDGTNAVLTAGAGVISLASASKVTGDLELDGAAGSLTFEDGDETVLIKDNDSTSLQIGLNDAAGALMTFDTANGTETVVIAGTTTVEAFLVDTGTATFDETVLISGDLTCSGGAGSLTFDVGDETVVVKDADATALDIGSATYPNLLRLDTAAGTPTVILDGVTAVEVFKVDEGTSTFDEDATFSAGATIVSPAFPLQQMRFCGNGANGATAWYLGLVGHTTAADTSTYDFAEAGCDGIDSGDEGMADLPWESPFVVKPTAMVCVIEDTVGGDTATFQLRSALGDVAGMVCTTPTLDTAGYDQCSVTDTTPASVAALATLTVKTTMSGTDNLSAAGVECRVYFTF